MMLASTTRCVDEAIPYTTHKIDPLTFCSCEGTEMPSTVFLLTTR